MVWHRVAFNQLDIELLAQLPQDATDIFAKPTEDCFLPVFRYDNYMVAAIPFNKELVAQDIRPADEDEEF